MGTSPTTALRGGNSSSRAGRTLHSSSSRVGRTPHSSSSGAPTSRIRHHFRARGAEFRIGLLVIDSMDIDIILGMDTLEKWGVKIDCAQRTVHLAASDGQEVGISASSPSGYLHQMEARPTYDIRIVCDYPDVFPDELPVMPPDRDIKFLIELLPGTAPIAMSQYRIAPIEHEEVKKNIDELLAKGYIRPSSSPWAFAVLLVEKNDTDVKRMCVDYRALNKTEAEHEEHLRLVLQRLSEHKLYAKFSKCEFWIDKMRFLGHVISKGEIAVDPSKVSTVTNWKVPEIPKKVRVFLGLAGYYRRFIENFSRIAKPMTSLLEKDADFRWANAQQAAFDELKRRLTTAPVLTLSDQQKKFIVYCDASRDGLGCVLMQKGKVIGYASRQLRKHEDYDMEIHYHPGKANVVADALSRKSYANIAVGFLIPHELCEEFERLSLGFLHHTTAAAFEAEPTLEREIREHQKDDEKLLEIRELLKLGKAPHFREDEQRILWYKNRICVPNVDRIRKLILSEAHDTAYSIHPGSTKMYYDLKERFWWYGMKRAVAEYVAICDTCQRVKAEHQRPAGLLQPLKKGYNSIWVVVDRLTKVAHFIPVNTTYSDAKLAELYISRIVCLHSVPKRIISDLRFAVTSRFLEQLHDSLGTKLRFSTAYHPQTDRQTERTNQILEDMLRVCAIQYGTSWDKCLPYAEFSYNNSYQASLKKSPFEALYGKRCRTPLFWNQTGEKQVFGPNIIQDAEQQLRIENLRVAQSRQRSYANVRRRDLSFKVDNHVYLKVSPTRGIRRFNMKGKLAPRYIGPFKILESKGEVSYRFELPPSLSGVHDVFYVFQLKKCLRVPEEQAPLEGLDVQEDLTYTEHPVKILDTSERNTRNKRIKMCRVQRPRQYGNKRMN
ncbi:LOW QUALITY PROTEIN: hypothetical protein U9M48_024803 [Paspalum notatum var. saurae]|uniref:Integrase catalytic domain-containing protein n=1 Tax=Paspalum notatum var. saurae TaxID=547442 RepID=A0AAQ3WXC9_PASNO